MAQFISDALRDPNQFQPHVFNLIQAPCGAGKSHFVATHLLNLFPDVEPWEVIFLTSRTITVDQQLAEYPSLRPFDARCAGIWRGTEQPTVEEKQKICLMTFDKVINILKNDLVPGHRPFEKAKIIVVDECHALIADDFVTGMQSLITELRNIMFLSSTLVIGLTATPRILIESERNHGFTLNTVFRQDAMQPLYRAKQLTTTTCEHLPSLLKDENYEGNTIVMTISIARAITLQRKIRGSSVVVSRHSNQWDPTSMEEIWESLVHRGAFPERCDLPIYGKDDRITGYTRGKLRVLIMTSVAREGLTIRAESGVRNVVCCYGDEMHLTQFTGRCRFDIQNLILCTDTFAFRNINPLLRAQNAECNKLIRGESNEYFRVIHPLVRHDVDSIRHYPDTDPYASFWDYLESKWLVQTPSDVTAAKLCTVEAKAEILQKAKKSAVFRLCKDRKRQHNFTLLCEIVEQTRGYSFCSRPYWRSENGVRLRGIVLLSREKSQFGTSL